MHFNSIYNSISTLLQFTFYCEVKLNNSKIAFLVDKSAPFFIGGYETEVYTYAKMLSNQNEYCAIYTSLDVASTTLDSIKFIKVSGMWFQKNRTNRSYLHSMLFSFALTKTPKGILDSNVIIIESIPYFHLFFLKRWLKKAHKLGIKKVLLVEEAWFHYGKKKSILNAIRNRLIMFLVKSNEPYFDYYWAISNVTGVSLLQNYHISKEKVRIIPPGHLEISKIDSFLQKSWRKYKKYDFVTIGRLVEIKHINHFLKALAKMKNEYAWNGCAAVIGEGPIYLKLVKLCDELGISKNVKFMGNLETTQKYEVICSSNVFILCSEREGLSHSTLEAISFGLPSLVARPVYNEVFGVSDLVKDFVNGFYYDVGDIDTLAQKMNYMLENPELMAAFGKKSREIAKNYDVGLTFKKFMELVS